LQLKPSANATRDRLAFGAEYPRGACSPSIA